MNYPYIGLLKVGDDADAKARDHPNEQGDPVQATRVWDKVRMLVLQLLNLFVPDVNGDADWKRRGVVRNERFGWTFKDLT